MSKEQTSEPLIRISDLSVSFGHGEREVKAVRQTSLEIGRGETLALVGELASSGIGVVMVLHDLNLAARCADKILVLDEGRIAAQGTPAEVLTRAVIDQVFGVDVEIGEHPITHQLMVIS